MDETPSNHLKYLAAADVRRLTGLSLTTLWRLRRRGELAEPVRLSPGRVAWREADIADWLDSRRTAARS